ncbi:N-formylglutamate amidohydrolase [Neptunomonas antarctica]|uniref:Predicted N-formylglutamate amidohydrolase n=1 Tax=Neptunomonas antarctica TaxID=619304 RepID=A0A1N7NE54_9GAMM|nr:N-formylglutamate amidohydrolase [Neptunomonas antarctica]SIS96469.1 Predicted N-formylglutamate amidohydrolase [Neptunomonas antarctica]
MMMQGLEQSSAELINPQGQSDVLLVCEHASHYIPENFANLGLSEAERLSHIGWDIGAAGMAQALSTKLDASLILQRYSRLLYDCNRPPSEASAVPPLSEMTEIPGNKDLTAEQRDYRVQHIYRPFHAEIAQQIAARKAAGRQTILVTIHSFTPLYMGQSRTVQLGVICHESNTFAKAFYQQASLESGFDIRMNEPYGPSDPVLHMVTRHGDEQQIPNVMLEVRNDLLIDAVGQHAWAQRVADALNSLERS